MKKHIYKGNCSCEGVDFKVIYQADEAVQIYCPFCGTMMEDEKEYDDEEE